ncbi:ABCG27 [Symbiodinium natans]|uniref:ABCG27 protein n=1 Tax=Symbiodinium natans TaxID=878477 RepID=A0A812N2R6_9DINO|nr:ABCG27 [Symbiodinium natans]
MATPSSKSVKSEIPNTIRVDWNDAELNAHTLFCDDQKLIAAVSLDVDLVAKVGKGGAEEKRILNKVSGFALPGELLAIMGPSGAGKTSLLNCLAVRTSPTEGSLTFNATEYSASLKRRIAYVHQQEMLLECYTPKEHLLFQSTLRMPRDVTSSQRRERVAKCLHLQDVNLSAAKVGAGDTLLQ